MHVELKELAYIHSFFFYSRLTVCITEQLLTDSSSFIHVCVHSLTYPLEQHPLIHYIHFSPVDAWFVPAFVLGSGNIGSGGTVGSWTLGHGFWWGKVYVLCACGRHLSSCLRRLREAFLRSCHHSWHLQTGNRAPGEEKEVRSRETLDPKSLWYSYIQGAPWMTEGMSWRRLRSVLSKVVDGGVTGRGNCRSRALKEQLSAQPRQPWPEPRPWQREPRMPIEEVGAIGFSAGVRGGGCEWSLQSISG